MTAIVIGHIWPVQLRFRGGKGAATALGIMLVFDPVAAAMLLAGGTVVLAITRRFTISGLAAIVATPFVAAARGHSTLEIASLGLMAALIVYAHRANLRALRSPIDRLSPPGRQEVAQ